MDDLVDVLPLEAGFPAQFMCLTYRGIYVPSSLAPAQITSTSPQQLSLSCLWSLVNHFCPLLQTCDIFIAGATLENCMSYVICHDHISLVISFPALNLSFLKKTSFLKPFLVLSFCDIFCVSYFCHSVTYFVLVLSIVQWHIFCSFFLSLKDIFCDSSFCHSLIQFLLVLSVNWCNRYVEFLLSFNHIYFKILFLRPWDIFC